MGGFIIESIGIQYVFYLIAGLCGLSSVVAIPLLRETYAPIIRLRRAKLTRDPEKATFTDANLSGVPTSKLRYLWDNLTRPMIILTHSFICFILSFYMALSVVSFLAIVNKLTHILGSMVSAGEDHLNRTKTILSRCILPYVCDISQ